MDFRIMGVTSRVALEIFSPADWNVLRTPSLILDFRALAPGAQLLITTYINLLKLETGGGSISQCQNLLIHSINYECLFQHRHCSRYEILLRIKQQGPTFIGLMLY